MENTLDLLEALEHIDPAVLSYQEWFSVGMGLKERGYPGGGGIPRLCLGGLEPPGRQTVSSGGVPAQVGQLHRECGAGHRRHGYQDGHGHGLAACRLQAGS